MFPWCFLRVQHDGMRNALGDGGEMWAQHWACAPLSCTAPVLSHPPPARHFYLLWIGTTLGPFRRWGNRAQIWRNVFLGGSAIQSFWRVSESNKAPLSLSLRNSLAVYIFQGGSKKSLKPEKLSLFNTYFKIPSLGLQVRDNILPEVLSCAETGTLKRAIWPVGFLLWGCISKHTALQGARTKLFAMESFLRLTSLNKVTAVLQREDKTEMITHQSLLGTRSMKQ